MRVHLVMMLLSLACSARGECMMISPFFAESGTVPPNPRLILFWPRDHFYPQDPRLGVADAKGRPLPFRLERLSRADAYDSFAVSVEAPAGTSFAVESSSGYYRVVRASFTADAAWARPAPPAASWSVSSSTYAWPCSFERASAASLPAAAPAYLVRWRPAGGGPLSTLVLPASPSWFHDSRRASQPLASLKLGHLNCNGWNFRWDDPKIVLNAAPLYPDGSEGPASPDIPLEAPPRLGPEGRFMPDLPPPAGE